MSKTIITINRECGSGGREIARLLGEKLNLKVYDKAILEAICEKYKLNEKEIQRIKAKKLNLWDDICQFYQQFGTVTGNYQSESRKITSRELFYSASRATPTPYTSSLSPTVTFVSGKWPNVNTSTRRLPPSILTRPTTPARLSPSTLPTCRATMPETTTSSST